MADENSGTDKRYPYDELRYGMLDPDSLSDDEKRKFGEAEKKHQIIVVAIVFAIAFVIGWALIMAWFATDFDDDYIVVSAFGFLLVILGLILGIVLGIRTKITDPLYFAGDGVKRANKKFEKTYPALANGMHAEMNNPDRPIYKDFYLEWQALREKGVYPQTFVNGWRHGGTQPVDILVDETDGKMAVCSYYTSKILGVYDTNKIIGCELQNNGTVVYTTTANGGISRGIVGGILAGGVGAVIGSNTAKRETTEERKDEYRVVVLYDDLNATGIAFEFDANRGLAENVYRVFTILERRNHGLAGVADEDIFKDM